MRLPTRLLGHWNASPGSSPDVSSCASPPPPAPCPCHVRRRSQPLFYQQLASLLGAELQPLSVQLAEQHARLQVVVPLPGNPPRVLTPLPCDPPHVLHFPSLIRHVLSPLPPPPTCRAPHDATHRHRLRTPPPQAIEDPHRYIYFNRLNLAVKCSVRTGSGGGRGRGGAVSAAGALRLGPGLNPVLNRMQVVMPLPLAPPSALSLHHPRRKLSSPSLDPSRASAPSVANFACLFPPPSIKTARAHTTPPPRPKSRGAADRPAERRDPRGRSQDGVRRLAGGAALRRARAPVQTTRRPTLLHGPRLALCTQPPSAHLLLGSNARSNRSNEQPTIRAALLPPPIHRLARVLHALRRKVCKLLRTPPGGARALRDALLQHLPRLTEHAPSARGRK